MVRMVTETAARGARDPGDPAGVVRGVRALLLGAAGVLLSGCATPYLLQAASGEWQLLHRRVPIDSLLADPRTPLAVRGFDVAVDGVPAYSTLGRFADPVLSSMLGYGDDELAATIFHELAHQLLYVRDDSQFNEAFASTVEDEGLERWLRHLGAGERLRQLRERDADAAAFADLMAQARSRLARLYASGAPRVEMRARKAEVLAGLAGKMRALEQRRGVSYPLYEDWIAAGLNNARLASVSTYYGCLAGFRRVLAESGNDLARFYAAVRELSRLPRTERHARLCVALEQPAGS